MTRRRVIMVLAVVGAVVAVLLMGLFVDRARDAAQTWPAEDQIAQTDLTPGEGTFVDPTEVDRTDPDAVAEAVALLTASHDTATDYTETAALLRAEGLLAPELQEGIVEPERGAGGQQWMTADQHDAYTLPEATPLNTHAQHDHGGVEHGHDEAVMSAAGEPVEPYEFRVTYRWQGREGEDGLRWTSNPDQLEARNVQMSLAERDGEWVVVEHLYSEPLTTEYNSG